MAKAQPDGEEIATLRIELLDTDPLIWRQVEVPTSISLSGLHDVVQAAMGWRNQHLWELALGRQRYGRPMRDDEDWGGPPVLPAAKTRLADVLKPRSTVFTYLYDFGDSWEHRLTITDVRHGETGVAYPRYIGGEFSAPPEDCGGAPGFYALLDVLADPAHPEHQEIVEWLGGNDPRQFNDLALKHAVGRVAARRRAARSNAAKQRTG